MASKKVGLPEGYDLRVTADDLLGEPTTLAGYLDDKPDFTSFVSPAKKEVVKKVKPQRERVSRMQINVTPEVQKKAEELLDILSRQSPDGRVTLSELMQSLIINAYDV